MAIVHVGGHTEVEMKEKKDRVDDALHATKAALEEGIIPGGGVALSKISKRLSDLFTEDDLGSEFKNDGEIEGAHILLDAICKPFIKILENSGLGTVEAEDIIANILENEEYWLGYDVEYNREINLFENGIIDPTKVTRLALENAASVAGTMLITEAVVSNIKKKEQQAINPAMMGM